jgi:hypothetical protein
MYSWCQSTSHTSRSDLIKACIAPLLIKYSLRSINFIYDLDEYRHLLYIVMFEFATRIIPVNTVSAHKQTSQASW